MPKVSYTKFGLKRLNEVNTIKFLDNDIIEVKKYLPIQEKLELIEFVINNSIDDNRFANPIKIDVFTNLGILYYYTNITFTDKQKEDAPKLFDVCEENGLIDAVIAGMDETEYYNLTDAIKETIEAYYKYTNSAYGIMEGITADYNNLNLEVDDLTNKISNPENLTLVKDVLTKLG